MQPDLCTIPTSYDGRPPCLPCRFIMGPGCCPPDPIKPEACGPAPRWNSPGISWYSERWSTGGGSLRPAAVMSS